jgi:phenylalanyl-tRNA synthetase beta chain
LQTDASFRYERGSDVDITVYALKHAAQLIKEIAGGFPSSEIIDVYPKPIENKIVSLDFDNLDRIVGKSIDREVVLSIITDLGMNILKATSERISVKVPGFKSDVTRESDLIEEVLRIYGYNNVEILPEIRASLSYSTKPDTEKIQDTISGYLSSMGFHEIMNNSLSKSTDYEGNKDFPVGNPVKILNPLSRDLDTMRQTLLYGGLETIIYNQNRKIQDLKLFEFGTVYSLGSGLSTDPLPGYHEEKHLALFLTGRVEPENWNSRDQQVGFFDLKGIVEAIFTKLGIYHPAFRDGNLTGETYSSGIISEGFRYSANGKTVVIFGFLRDSILKTFECRYPVLYAEWNWDALLAILPKREIQVTELNKFPEVRRDLALLLDRSVNFKQIEQIAYDIERKMIKKINLFDVYEGPNIQPDKKSYAISFILQDEQKTLTDDVIEKTMERLIKAFSTKLNAQIR